MAVLHDELNRVIGEVCEDSSVKAEVVRSIIAKHGVSLSDPQLQSLVQALHDAGGSDSVEMAVDGLTQTISISSEDVEHALHAFEDKLIAGAEGVVNHALEHMAPSILNSLYAALPEALQE